MTTIAGLCHNGQVWLGGDSCITWGDRAELVHEPKVWKRGELVFGVAGSWRGLQLIRYGLPKLPPLPNEDTDAALAKWLTVPFARALRKCRGDEQGVECELLLGVRGRLYIVDEALSWLRPVDGIAAVGSGADAAVATLRATTKRAAPKTRLARALIAATRQFHGTRPWFNYVSA